MKVIIVGAGELGRLLAKILSHVNHEVVVIDSSYEELERLGDQFDIMRIEGSCTSVSVLKDAGAADAQALLAVSGDEASNIIACQIASKLGIRQTICRLFKSDSISEKDGVSPESFGIWKTFSTPEVSVRKIMEILRNRAVLEHIQFGHPDACMEIVRITDASGLVGVRLRDIAAPEMLKTVRIAAILHNSQFLIPSGDTIIGKDDRLYVAGTKAQVRNFVDSITSYAITPTPRIVIAGASVTGVLLAKMAFEANYDVRLIERSKRIAENVRDDLPTGLMIIHGDSTSELLLEEAGADTADVFISTADDDEDNILSCIMAKRIGAKKVVALTHKPEYIRIVPTMDLIDCGFSSSLTSVNAILRCFVSGAMRLDANLLHLGASFSEYKITKKSPIVGRALKDCQFPPGTILALIFRDGEVVTPSGDTVLQVNDTAVAIVTVETAKRLESLFPRNEA